ncbi:MAG: hypothetical protein LUE98_09395 [Tannerellaceae bacterium]|nr:hypothetical protein [Tannerellaceae bacterium]
MKNPVHLLPFGFLLLVCLLFVACSSKTSLSDKIVKINLLDNNYPIKEINLDDIADVSYIHFESDKDEYLFGGWLFCLSSKTVIFAHRSGDIHFFPGVENLFLSLIVKEMVRKNTQTLWVELYMMIKRMNYL